MATMYGTLSALPWELRRQIYRTYCSMYPGEVPFSLLAANSVFFREVWDSLDLPYHHATLHCQLLPDSVSWHVKGPARRQKVSLPDEFRHKHTWTFDPNWEQSFQLAERLDEIPFRLCQNIVIDISQNYRESMMHMIIQRQILRDIATYLVSIRHSRLYRPSAQTVSFQYGVGNYWFPRHVPWLPDPTQREFAQLSIYAALNDVGCGRMVLSAAKELFNSPGNMKLKREVRGERKRTSDDRYLSYEDLHRLDVQTEFLLDLYLDSEYHEYLDTTRSNAMRRRRHHLERKRRELHIDVDAEFLQLLETCIPETDRDVFKRAYKHRWGFYRVFRDWDGGVSEYSSDYHPHYELRGTRWVRARYWEDAGNNGAQVHLCQGRFELHYDWTSCEQCQ